MKTKKYAGMIVAILVSATLQAQTDSIPAPKIFQFKLGVFYNSALNYYGRTDSLHSSGFFPLAELGIGKNFYINAAPVFVNNKAVSFSYAGTVATAGYRFNATHKFSGNIYVVKPFYQSNTDLVESALKEQVATSFTWSSKPINITIGGDIKISDNLDYGAMAGLDHLFRWKLSGQSVLALDPSAYINAGTQQFTRTYYKQNNFLIFPGTEQAVTEKVKDFNILSYEFSLPVVFGKGKLQLLAIPAYVIPQNLVQVANRPDLSEQGKDMFYVTVGAKMNF